MERCREVQQCTHSRGAFRAAGREEACYDVMERCGIMHMAGGRSRQQRGRRRHAAMSQRGVAACTLQGGDQSRQMLAPHPP
jgi:hypothetical protein